MVVIAHPHYSRRCSVLAVPHPVFLRFCSRDRLLSEGSFLRRSICDLLSSGKIHTRNRAC